MLSTLLRRKGRSMSARTGPAAAARAEAETAPLGADLGQIAQDAVQLAAVGPHLAAFAGEVEKQARSQAARAAAMAQAMERLAGDLHAAVAELRSSSGQMGRALETVGHIADHTRILSINASIEAARAGEQGKAFGVIVDEVKQLADRTGRTTLDIGARMGEFAANLGRMDAVTQARPAGPETGGALSVGDVNLQVRGIAESAGFQLTNAESVHEMGGQVKALTESLLLAVGKFRFDAHARATQAVEELLPGLIANLGDRAGLEALLEDWLHARPHFELVYLTDTSGRQIVDNLAQRAGRVTHDPAGFGRDWSARPWYVAALAHPGACATDVYRSSATGDFCFTVAAALRDGGGEVLGVIGSDVNFQRLVSG
jgi:methyl-accepting chemotaxis protein